MSRRMVLCSKISWSITSVDPAMLMSSSAEPLDDSVCNRPYKFPFIPPSDSFNLHYYTSQLYFRIPDSTLTGCYVDQYSIQIFAPGKPKITASLELISSDYYIWYSKAPAPVVYRALFDSFACELFLYLNKTDS